MNSAGAHVPRHWLACLCLLVAGALSASAPEPAFAQYVVAIVNGEPITAQDVAQRLRLNQIGNRRNIARSEIVEELVVEKLKLQAASRASIEIKDDEVDRIFAQLARNSGRNVADFAKGLTQQGLDVRRFKTRIKAELAWRQVMQQRAPASFMVRDADIVALLTARGQQTQIKAIQYSLRQFVFVVPRGSPQTVLVARVREAEAFRKSFAGCEAGAAQARQLREVVVRDPVVRLSSDLAPKLKDLLERTPIGTLTPPEPIAGGIEVVAVCARKETIADVSSRREVREELLGQRMQIGEKELLDKYRKGSIIEYRTEPKS
jgi:peptidyl-prolyl cis-trans isomerase SurA